MKKLIGAGLFILGIMMALNVSAQRSLTMECVNEISSLTDDQKEAITELNDTYQDEMAELRTERRETTETEEKDAVQEKMTELRANHHEEVKSLMSEEQQAEFDELYADGAGKFKNKVAEAGKNRRRAQSETTGEVSEINKKGNAEGTHSGSGQRYRGGDDDTKDLKHDGQRKGKGSSSDETEETTEG